jgi:predicted flap endonuclease-1-like 5' DNA nuclease
MNPRNPDQSNDKKGSLGRPNRTSDKESVIDNNHSKSMSQVDHIDTQQTNIDINLEIQDVDGVGPTTTKKLREAGIVSVMELAVNSGNRNAETVLASNSHRFTQCCENKILNEYRITYFQIGKA